MVQTVFTKNRLHQMRWLPPSLDGIAMWQDGGVINHLAERTTTKAKDAMIGVDLAKSVFQVHGALTSGDVKFRKKLSRPQFLKFMAGQAPEVVALEARGSANFLDAGDDPAGPRGEADPAAIC